MSSVHVPRSSSPLTFVFAARRVLSLSLPWLRQTSIVVESPAITTTLSVLWGHKLPSERQLAEGVEGIMNRHGLRTAMFFGHSFGSISVGWIARRKPHVIDVFTRRRCVRH